MKRALPILLIAAFFAGCTPDAPDLYKDLTKLEFKSTNEDFANPERGFYRPVEIHSADAAVFFPGTVTSLRKFSFTLMLLEFYLTDYMESDIEQAFLDKIQECFTNLREGGGKAIVRFAYKSSEDDKPWDASEQWVLRHIEQVAPILQENEDVLLAVQAGFVGVWGEWYYTTNFNMNPSSDESFLPRKHVLEALLRAVPESRQVQLRTPQFKMRLMGLSLADTLTAATAHNGTAVSRVGGHNDCFLASSNDTGTYKNAEDRPFWKADTRYTLMGGESCAVSQYCKCDNALSELEGFHWTYLNSAYHTSVLGKWRTENCYDEVSLRLGYRLSIEKAYITPKIAANTDYRLVLMVRNEGFAAPMNPRGAEMIFEDASGKKTAYNINTDPRLWQAGTTTTLDIDMPGLAAGEYTIWLNLPDPQPSLHDNPFYSIRLANKDVWDEETGYNKITTIKVQ
ncbi:MAG: DUF4832 domain-containing protein [Bacteroidales bacterium]|nr:DUF4832 domain-containing protein [Bacteroidales bacterium]